MGGPAIPFKFGREDFSQEDAKKHAKIPDNGRLPDASLEGDESARHLRSVFYRYLFWSLF